MDALALIASLLCFGAAAFLLTGALHRTGRHAVRRFEDGLSETLTELFVFDTTPRRVTVMVAGFAGILTAMVYLLSDSLLAAAVAAAVVLVAPFPILRLMAKRRRSRLETQLMDGLITLANGMRSGLNLSQAMGLIEDHGEKPIRQEIGLVMREIEHGTSVDVALDNAGRRLKSHNYQLLFAAMKTTRLRGGNMPDTLDRLGESLREIVRLEEKIKAQTAEGRTSALFMGIMPLVVLIIYQFIDPSGLTLLFSDPYGHAVLLLAALLNLWGFLWIRKIVSFDV